ncbi:MAG: hypothetical protein KJP23_13865 [Deltaproteobacteria bacterium]|nr:hypothetical protein [Deltaproteobacteria bacterium]
MKTLPSVFLTLLPHRSFIYLPKMLNLDFSAAVKSGKGLVPDFCGMAMVMW